jgi:hypothetical protein
VAGNRELRGQVRVDREHYVILRVNPVTEAWHEMQAHRDIQKRDENAPDLNLSHAIIRTNQSKSMGFHPI